MSRVIYVSSVVIQIDSGASFAY